MADNEDGRTVTLKPLQTSNERRQVIECLYSSIKPWETRLLCLQPGDSNEPLAATLHAAVITYAEGLSLPENDESLEFEALSYTWGGEIFSHPLVCNGLTIGITSNLSGALHHLREKDKSKYLWVDAVCINQLNNNEKSKQVRNIYTIFKKASQVVVWLGNEGENTEAAVALLRGKSYSFEDLPIGELEDIWKALLDLATRPWLSRAWVAQEVHAARSTQIWCGSHAMSWVEFRRIVERLEELETQLEELNNMRSDGSLSPTSPAAEAPPSHRVVSMRAFDFLVDIPKGADRSPVASVLGSRRLISLFCGLLRFSSHFEATDPRDKIWALVNLFQIPVVYGALKASVNEDAVINIDYSKTVAQAYAEATRFLIHWLGAPELLLPCYKPSRDDLPSWSFDFSCGKIPKTHRRLDPASRLVPRIESYSLTAVRVGASVSQSRDWSVLALSGWHVGTVCSLHSGKTDTHGWEVYRPEYFHAYEDVLTWNNLVRDTAVAKALVEVMPTACLQTWMLKAAYRPIELFDPVRYNSVDEQLYEIKARLDSFLCRPEDVEKIRGRKIADYVSETRSWRVAGTPEVNDILVSFRGLDNAVILRPLNGIRYRCVGRAKLADSLSVVVTPTSKWMSAEQLWSASEIVGNPRLRGSNGEGAEVKRTFHTY